MTGRKVLVLGKSDSSFLTVIRSLGRRGIAVHIAWCPPTEVAVRSRYVRAIHQLPPFSPVDDAWKRALIALCERERFDLIIPTNDPTIIPLQSGMKKSIDLLPAFRVHASCQTNFRRLRSSWLHSLVPSPFGRGLG